MLIGLSQTPGQNHPTEINLFHMKSTDSGAGFRDEHFPERNDVEKGYCSELSTKVSYDFLSSFKIDY